MPFTHLPPTGHFKSHKLMVLYEISIKKFHLIVSPLSVAEGCICYMTLGLSFYHQQQKPSRSYEFVFNGTIAASENGAQILFSTTNNNLAEKKNLKLIEEGELFRQNLSEQYFSHEEVEKVDYA